MKRGGHNGKGRKLQSKSLKTWLLVPVVSLTDSVTLGKSLPVPLFVKWGSKPCLCPGLLSGSSEVMWVKMLSKI